MVENCNSNIDLRMMKEFYRLLEQAFSPDYEIAFQGAVNQARYLGVPEEEILIKEKKLMLIFRNRKKEMLRDET